MLVRYFLFIAGTWFLSGVISNTAQAAASCETAIAAKNLYDAKGIRLVQARDTFYIDSEDGFSAQFKFADREFPAVTKFETVGDANTEHTRWTNTSLELSLTHINQIIRHENYYYLATNFGLIKVKARNLAKSRWPPRARLALLRLKKQVVSSVVFWNFDLIASSAQNIETTSWDNFYDTKIYAAKSLVLTDQETIEVEFGYPQGRAITLTIPIDSNPMIIYPFTLSDQNLYQTFLHKHHIADQQPYDDFLP